MSELFLSFIEDMKGVVSDNYLYIMHSVINFIHGKQSRKDAANAEVAKIRDLKVNKIGESYIKSYHKWMVEANYQNSTIQNHLRFIKLVLNHNQELYELDLSYLKAKNIKVTRKKPFWLTPEDINILVNHSFSWEKRINNRNILTRVRDYKGEINHEIIDKLLLTRRNSEKWETLFSELSEVLPKFYNTLFCSKTRAKDEWLFRYQTGIRNQDSDQLRPHHFKNMKGTTYINFNMLKNGRDFLMPISSGAVKILEKYNYYLPKITQQEKDRIIKKCFEEAGLSGVVEKIKNIGSKRIVELVPKYNMVATHTARRSFGRRWMESIGNIESLSQYLGHSSSSITRIYIGWELEEYADMVESIEF